MSQSLVPAVATREDPLGELSDRLADHFAVLCDARKTSGRPVYLIEHGCDAAEIERVFLELWAALSVRPIEHHELWWGNRSLPLLIAASEVG